MSQKTGVNLQEVIIFQIFFVVTILWRKRTMHPEKIHFPLSTLGPVQEWDAFFLLPSIYALFESVYGKKKKKALPLLHCAKSGKREWVFVYRHWCEENEMVFVSHEVPFPAMSDRRSRVAGNGTEWEVKTIELSSPTSGGEQWAFLNFLILTAVKKTVPKLRKSYSPALSNCRGRRENNWRNA